MRMMGGFRKEGRGFFSRRVVLYRLRGASEPVKAERLKRKLALPVAGADVGGVGIGN